LKEETKKRDNQNVEPGWTRVYQIFLKGNIFSIDLEIVTDSP